MVIERRASVLVDRAAEHAEGPIWDGRDDTLIWVDQYRGLIRRAEIDEAGRAHELPGFDLKMPIGALAPAADGWIVAAGNGFHLLDREGGLRPVADVLPSDGPRRRMNDGKCDPQGRFWAGSMAYEKVPGAGDLYRLEDDKVSLALANVTISNGLAWTHDGATLFYIDTPTHEIRRFAVTPEGLSDEGVLVHIPRDEGAPDGMCIASDGTLWVALWGGSAVHRYSGNGELIERIQVDAVQVSSCCFGGSDGSTLFITTSQEGYGPEQLAADPRAGMIFAVSTDTSAPPAADYRPASSS